MEDKNDEKLTEFKQMLQEHVHDLKVDVSDTESSMEMDQCNEFKTKTDDKEELHEVEDANETLPIDTQVPSDIINSDCLMLCGRILRIMGDEVTCRACGKSLRNIGDEIFCNYATRNILTSLLKDLSRNQTVNENVR